MGNDAYGSEMLSEMRRAGMNIRYVGVAEQYPTALSICLQYPDKEGCNFTVGNSAAIMVTPEYIRRTLSHLNLNRNSILAAIPEVSFESRVELLKKGRQVGGFCVLSITKGEAEQLHNSHALQYCDLLAVNLEEAEAIAGNAIDEQSVAAKLWKYAAVSNPTIAVIVTCGPNGAYVCTTERVEHIPPVPSIVANTSGAGDAFLGGTLAALALGYPLQKGTDDTCFAETPLASAAELGALCAGVAVECEDSIAAHLSAHFLFQKIRQQNWSKEPYFLETR